MGVRRGMVMTRADIIMGYGGYGARVIPIRERYGGLYRYSSTRVPLRRLAALGAADLRACSGATISTRP